MFNYNRRQSFTILAPSAAPQQPAFVNSFAHLAPPGELPSLVMLCPLFEKPQAFPMQAAQLLDSSAVPFYPMTGTSTEGILLHKSPRVLQIPAHDRQSGPFHEVKKPFSPEIHLLFRHLASWRVVEQSPSTKQPFEFLRRICTRKAMHLPAAASL